MTRAAEECQKKRIFIWSDNAGLSRAIELNLAAATKCTIERCNSGESSPESTLLEDLALLIVALSSPNTNPVEALIKAGLTGALDQVPVLVISNEPVYTDFSGRFIHLGFPFDLTRLQAAVQQLTTLNLT